MYKKGLILVGWYHSHPISEPKPSHNDVISQRTYQEALRRPNGDEPCIGVIIGQLTLIMTKSHIHDMYYVIKLLYSHMMTYGYISNQS